MHAYYHGVLVFVIKIILAPLNNEKKELDMIAVEMFQYPKNNQRSEYPCYMFSKGITNLTLLTASECVGVAFVLAMFTESSCGQHFWSNVNKRL